MKHLTAWELESVEWTSEEVKVDKRGGEGGGRYQSLKMEVTVFCTQLRKQCPFTFVIFCLLKGVTVSSHTQGEGIIQRHEFQEVGIIWAILEVFPLQLPIHCFHLRSQKWGFI